MHAYSEKLHHLFRCTNSEEGNSKEMESEIIFFAVQQSYSGLGRLTVETSISHTIIHTLTHRHTHRHTHTHTQKHPVGLFWTSDQLVAGAHNYTTNTSGRISVPSAGFEPAIPTIKRL